MFKIRALLFPVLLVTTQAVWAQKNDVAILGGWSTTQSQAVVGVVPAGLITRNATTTSPSFQVSYVRQLVEGAVDPYGRQTVALGVELPLIVAIRDTSTTVLTSNGSQTTGGSGADLFFTPGVRVKMFQAALVSISGSAGFGVASFAPSALSTILDPSGALSTTSPAVLIGPRQNSPALGFGTAFDIRFSQPISVRVDTRDFVTKTGLGGASGRNHAIFQLGLAFHF